MSTVPRPGPVREHLVPALVPATRGAHPPPAPLPTLSTPPADASLDVVAIGAARVDRSGRIGVAPLLPALGWTPGDPIDLDVYRGSIVVVAADPAGRQRIRPRRDLALPTPLCALCGITRGSTVVLAALNHRPRLLLVHPATTIIALLDPLHRQVRGARHGR